MKLSNQDNNKLVEYVNQFNIGKSINDKVAMDCYVSEIYAKDDDVILECEIIKPIPPEGCPEENVGKSSGIIGTKLSLKLSDIDTSLVDNVITPFLRDKKISEIIK